MLIKPLFYLGVWAPPLISADACQHNFHDQDRHYQSVVASALDAAADAAEAAAHRAQLRWEAEDWETAKADVRRSILVLYRGNWKNFTP